MRRLSLLLLAALLIVPACKGKSQGPNVDDLLSRLKSEDTKVSGEKAHASNSKAMLAAAPKLVSFGVSWSTPEGGR